MALNIDVLTLGPMCRTKGMTAHVRVSLNFVIRTRIACWLIDLVERVTNTLRDRDTARKVPSVIGERKRCFDVTSAGLEHVPSHALKFPGSEAGHRLVQPGMVRSALRATCCGTVIDRLAVSINLKPRLARSAHFEDAAP